MPIPQWRITFDVENRMTQRPGFAQSPFGTNIQQYFRVNHINLFTVQQILRELVYFPIPQ
jgi:hypothetical protein